jgi:hypothetical protein
MSMGSKAYATILFVLGAIAMVAFAHRPTDDAAVPANSLVDQQEPAAGRSRGGPQLHQPTILRADPAVVPESEQPSVEVPLRLSAEPAAGDEELHRPWRPTDLAPPEFLTIPGIESTQRR